MIKFESNNGQTSLDVAGNLTELEADATIFVKALYDALYEHDEEVGKSFRKDFETVIKLGVPFCGQNDEDLDKVIDKAMIELLQAKVNELKGKMEELKND